MQSEYPVWCRPGTWSFARRGDGGLYAVHSIQILQHRTFVKSEDAMMRQGVSRGINPNRRASARGVIPNRGVAECVLLAVLRGDDPTLTST